MLLTVILIIISFYHPLTLLEAFLFCESFPPQPFLFFFRTDYMDSPDYSTVTSEHIRFLLFSFSVIHI